MMKKMISLALLAFVVSSSYSQRVKLVLNLEQGKTYTQSSSSKAHVSQELMGQKMDMDVFITGEMAYLVKEAGDDAYILEASYTKLSMKMNLPGTVMESSSEAGEEGDELSRVLAAMVGKPFEIIMDKNGKVREVKDAEAIWESAIGEMGGLDQARQAQFKQQIDQAYGTGALKGNIEMTTAILPGKRVRPGAQWTVETQLESGFSVKSVSVYEYAGMEGDKALIKGVSAISTLDGDKYSDAAGIPIKYLLEGEAESEIWVDVNSGWLAVGKQVQAMEGTLKLKDSPQTPGGMSIPMSVSSEAELTGSY